MRRAYDHRLREQVVRSGAVAYAGLWNVFARS
jgi:hypothetical protein